MAGAQPLQVGGHMGDTAHGVGLSAGSGDDRVGARGALEIAVQVGDVEELDVDVFVGGGRVAGVAGGVGVAADGARGGQGPRGGEEGASSDVAHCVTLLSGPSVRGRRESQASRSGRPVTRMRTGRERAGDSRPRGVSRGSWRVRGP